MKWGRKMFQIREMDRKLYQGLKPPKYLALLLTKIGGLNRYNEPNFRLVWAKDRMTPSGGVWLDWGSTAPADRNQVASITGNTPRKPWRREVGVRMIHRYGPVDGWALERWVPAKMYGSPEQWNSPTTYGGTMIVRNFERIPSQGTYPSRGDYEYAGFLFTNEQLSEFNVIQCMQALIADQEALPDNPARRIAVRSQVAKAAQEEADKQYESWALDVVQSFQPAFDGPFVGAGKKHSHSKNAIARRLHIKEHTGVS